MMTSDGIFPLPPGKLAALVTYLVHDLGMIPASSWPEVFHLERIGGQDLATYRALFQAVGGEWLWFSRLRMSDTELGAILSDEAVEAYALRGPDGNAGLLELDFRDQATPELGFFGLVPGLVGQGLGRALMVEALQRAKARGAASLHVHTCSLDHPRALDFYCRSGFRPVRRAVEILTDPRLDGTLPRNVAAFMPVIG